MDKELILEKIKDVEKEYEDIRKLVNWDFNGLTTSELKEIKEAFSNTIIEFEYLKDVLIEQLELELED